MKVVAKDNLEWNLKFGLVQGIYMALKVYNMASKELSFIKGVRAPPLFH
jgi:hypothetical protein